MFGKLLKMFIDSLYCLFFFNWRIVWDDFKNGNDNEFINKRIGIIDKVILIEERKIKVF